MESVQKLNDETIAELQGLTQINFDSRDGFRHAAGEMKSAPIVKLFRELAEERARQAAELQHFVAINEKEPKREGSLAGAVHRTWITVRDAVSGSQSETVLAEAERGEDQIKQAYQAALKKTAGSAVNDVLQRHYAAVKDAHDRVRTLRDGTVS